MAVAELRVPTPPPPPEPTEVVLRMSMAEAQWLRTLLVRIHTEGSEDPIFNALFQAEVPWPENDLVDDMRHAFQDQLPGRLAVIRVPGVRR